MLGDVGEAEAHRTLELCVVVGDQSGQEGSSPCVDHVLSQLSGVLADFAERTGGDSLKGGFRFLNAEHEKRHSSCVDNGLGEICSVP